MEPPRRTETREEQRRQRDASLVECSVAFHHGLLTAGTRAAGYDRPVQRIAVTATLLLWTAAGLASLEPRLNTALLDEALRIGQSRVPDVRNRFHAPYRLGVGRAPIDFIEVVTPFRRIAMAAEEQVRLGGRLFGQRQALEALGPNPADVDIVVELTFHPLNTFVGVPAYDVQLIARKASTATVSPRAIQRTPRLGPRVPGTALPSGGGPANPTGGSQPVLGGTITATLDGERLDPRGVYDVLLLDGRTRLGEATIDFGRVR